MPHDYTASCIVMQQPRRRPSATRRARPRHGRREGNHVPTGQTGAMLPGATPTKGRLLVATPPLEDPNFDRTVVYMLEHHDEGALGVIINRPTPEQLDEPLDRWVDLQSSPNGVFAGGPVEPDALIALGLHPRADLGLDRRALAGRRPRRIGRPHRRPGARRRRARGGAHLPGLRRLGSWPTRARDRGRARGSCSIPIRATCSATSPRSCGAPSCAARAGASPGSPEPPTTSAPTDRNPEPSNCLLQIARGVI